MNINGITPEKEAALDKDIALFTEEAKKIRLTMPNNSHFEIGNYIEIFLGGMKIRQGVVFNCKFNGLSVNYEGFDSSIDSYIKQPELYYINKP